MSDPSGYGRGTRMVFHSPMSEARADAVVDRLAARSPGSIADYGCGWGELMLRVAEAVPDALAVGVDIFVPDLERGRSAAAARGLAHRVTFVEGAATDHAAPADLVLSSGSWQAFGDSVDVALKALRPLVKPGGTLFFGAEYWRRTPTDEELGNMWPGITGEEVYPLADLVDLAVAAGFRPLWIESNTRGEWDEFESRYALGAEEWLLANGDHPEAGAVREKIDTGRRIWLRGYRDVMGFAMLTLGVPS